MFFKKSPTFIIQAISIFIIAFVIINILPYEEGFQSPPNSPDEVAKAKAAAEARNNAELLLLSISVEPHPAWVTPDQILKFKVISTRMGQLNSNHDNKPLADSFNTIIASVYKASKDAKDTDSQTCDKLIAAINTFLDGVAAPAATTTAGGGCCTIA